MEKEEISAELRPELCRYRWGGWKRKVWECGRGKNPVRLRVGKTHTVIPYRTIWQVQTTSITSRYPWKQVVSDAFLPGAGELIPESIYQLALWDYYCY